MVVNEGLTARISETARFRRADKLWWSKTPQRAFQGASPRPTGGLRNPNRPTRAVSVYNPVRRCNFYSISFSLISISPIPSSFALAFKKEIYTFLP